MYVCPDCKAALIGMRCSHCNHDYPMSKGFPVLLPKDERYRESREIVDAYDSIYTEHSNVWENQGRSTEFIAYFAALIAKYQPQRVLEVGCGEGLVLAAIKAPEKFGTELSAQALQKTQARTPAQLSVALCERLPFPDNYFDLIASVGVMEHFIDDHAANSELRRAVKVGGHYIVLLHVPLTRGQSLQQKISEYIWPRPHPIKLVKWLAGKFYKPIHQPVQNKYTVQAAKTSLEQSGFDVMQVIHKGNTPGAPLIGPHVMIYVCLKSAES